MPCDIGYKSAAPARIIQPQVNRLKMTAKAPDVDAELLANLGQSDPLFVDFMNELDPRAIQEDRLNRALKSTPVDGKVTYSIDKAGLVAETKYVTNTEKAAAEREITQVTRRWQMEMLSSVLEILDFETIIKTQGAGDNITFTLEAEKRGEHSVHEYVRVTSTPDGNSQLMFEHFASKAELDTTRDKFLALAQKMGVRIQVGQARESGSPIEANVVHRHFIKGGKE